jgi:hypothetical protein
MDGHTQSLGPAHRRWMRLGPTKQNRRSPRETSSKGNSKLVPFFLLIGRLHSTIPLTPKIGGTPLLSLRASAGESVDAPHSYGPHRLVHLSICDRAICVCFVRSFLLFFFFFFFSFVFIIMISQISPASVCRLVALIAPLSFPPAAHTRLFFFTANPSIGQQFASLRRMPFMQIQSRNYRPAAVGRFHVAVDFEVPEGGAADEQVVDAGFGHTLLLELGARVALWKRSKMFVRLALD